MTAPYDYGDDDDTTPAPHPLRLIRGPLTRRRERRILIALTHFGPLDEFELYGILRATEGTLTKALLTLTAEGLITVESKFDLLHGSRRVWSTRVRLDGEN